MALTRIKMKLNQVINSDCLEVMRSMEDNCVDILLTDPPFGMNFQSNYRKTKHKKIENDDNLDWLEEFFSQVARICKPDAHFYIFCSHHNLDRFLETAKRNIPYKSVLIWEKNNTGMGDLKGDYAPKHEFIIFGNGGRDLNGSRDPAIRKETRTGNNYHPTEKPVELMVYFIEKSKNKDCVVFDPFAGSGTTGVACKKCGCDYILVEKEKDYCEIIEKRLSQQTLF